VTPGAERDAVAGAVFAALADPTRRAVLREVAARGPVTATELAGRVPVTRQAIAKHLGVLAEAGLVRAGRAGRENRFTAESAPLADAERWLRDAGRSWDDRLSRLEDQVRRHADHPRRG
jgi:DNA-binding transcriptional ArsR family regulator